jgi:hypothetical protein
VLYLPICYGISVISVISILLRHCNLSSGMLKLILTESKLKIF